MAVAVVIVVLSAFAFVVGRWVYAVLIGQLVRPFQREARRRVVARREADVLARAVRVKQALDAEAFAAHQRMLRAAQQHTKR